MSEGKSEIIQFPQERPITPEVKRIIKKVQRQIRTEKDRKEQSGVVDINEERFYRDISDEVHKPGS